MPRAARGRPRQPARATSGRGRHFDISEAPERSTGLTDTNARSRAIGSGFHPHFVTLEDDGYAVVLTEWGLHPVVVERGFKTPRAALSRMEALNTGGAG